MLQRLLHAVILFFSLAAAHSVCAGDWPQILGPQRNGIAVDEKVAAWKTKGPREVFTQPVGSGFAGVAVAKGKLILFHRQGDRELVDCLDAKTGKSVWTANFPTGFRPQIVDDDGPRCVPVIAGDAVVVYGAVGGLRCLQMQDGKAIWAHDCLTEFGAPEGYFGTGSTPLVETGKVLVNVGGDKQGAGIVAFDLKTGAVAWKSTTEQASYAAPTAVTVGKTRHAIFVTRLSAVSLNPADGAVRWQIPFGARGPTVNGATPIVLDGHVFLTASYGIGARWVKIGDRAAEVLWESDDILSGQYTTPVSRDGYLYGIDGRQDQGIARLRCLDPRTRKIAWTADGFGMATLILAGDTLVAMKTDGELVLARATPESFQPLAKAQLLPGTCRALPALANGLLYVRNENSLRCVDLRAP